MFKNALLGPKYILDKTVYEMHVSFCKTTRAFDTKMCKPHYIVLSRM